MASAFLQIGRDDAPPPRADPPPVPPVEPPGAEKPRAPWATFDHDDDDAGEETLGDIDADEDADGASAVSKKKRARIGTIAERWNVRLSRDTIAADLRDGCGCGCSDTLTVGEVTEMRTARSKEGDGVSGPREYMRDWLSTHRNSDAKLGFSLHASEETKKLCATGFDLLNGFGVGFTYKMIREYKKGNVADDPNLGGNRKSSAGAGGDAFSDDTVARMAFRGWWADLREDTEIMPNRPTTERQIDYIEHSELYSECKQDLIDSGMSEANIGTQVRSYPRARARERAPDDGRRAPVYPDTRLRTLGFWLSRASRRVVDRDWAARRRFERCSLLAVGAWGGHDA